jgi:hypothetical protein
MYVYNFTYIEIETHWCGVSGGSLLAMRPVELFRGNRALTWTLMSFTFCYHITLN